MISDVGRMTCAAVTLTCARRVRHALAAESDFGFDHTVRLYLYSYSLFPVKQEVGNACPFERLNGRLERSFLQDLRKKVQHVWRIYQPSQCSWSVCVSFGGDEGLRGRLRHPLRCRPQGEGTEPQAVRVHPHPEGVQLPPRKAQEQLPEVQAWTASGGCSQPSEQGGCRSRLVNREGVARSSTPRRAYTTRVSRCRESVNDLLTLCEQVIEETPEKLEQPLVHGFLNEDLCARNSIVQALL